MPRLKYPVEIDIRIDGEPLTEPMIAAIKRALEETVAVWLEKLGYQWDSVEVR